MCIVRKLLLALATTFLFATVVAEAKEIPFTCSSPEALKMLGQGLEMGDNYQTVEAAKYYRQVIAADPKCAIAYYLLAGTASTTDEYMATMLKAFEFAPTASEPEQIMIQVAKASIDGDASLTRTLLEKLVKVAPVSPRAHQMLGINMRARQEWSAAEQEFRTAIELDPQFASAYNELAYTLAGTGRYAEAIEALKKYIVLRPTDANPHDSMAEMYLWMGEHEKSIAEYNAALALDRAFVGSINGIGHNQVFQGKFDEARKTYDLWLTHAKNYGDSSVVFYWRALSYLHENRLDDAIGVWQEQDKYGRVHNDMYLQLEAHDNLARMYREKEDFAKSLTETEAVRALLSNTSITASSRDSYERSCVINSAIVQARQGNASRAQKNLVRLSEMTDRVPSASRSRQLHFVRGAVAYWGNEYQASITHFKQADSLSPQVKYHMALCLEKLGKGEEARKLHTWVVNWNHNDLALSLTRPHALLKLKYQSAIGD